MVDFERPILTVDVVVAMMWDGVLHVLLHKREAEPFKGIYALPGGWIHAQEDSTAEDAAARILRNKVGLKALHLEQLGTFSGHDRDPRGWSASIVYLAVVGERELLGLEPATGLIVVPIDAIPAACLAFDHTEIIQGALARIRAKAGYSLIPAAFIGERFTLRELQASYEALLGRQLNESSFRRKILGFDLIEECGTRHETTRPAKEYRLINGVQTFDRSMIQSW